MRDTTRRGFLRATSIGAITAGMLGALPGFVFAQEQTPSSAPAPTTPALELPVASPAGAAALPAFTVFVSGSPSTDAVIYIGEREIPITNRSVIDYLKQVAATG